MPIADAVTEQIGAHAHGVQLYQADERVLINNVVQFLLEGVDRDEGILVIGTSEHNKIFLNELQLHRPEVALRVTAGRARFLDATETLAKFMRDGQPDWDLFGSAIATVADEMRLGRNCPEIRAYGEMVGILWKEELYSAAIRLEEFWNKLLEFARLKLFCAYPIDIFSEDFHNPAVEGLLAAHTHLVSSGHGRDLEGALHRAMDDVLGFQATEVRTRIANEINGKTGGTFLPAAEASIRAIRTNIPADAEAVLSRARHYYRSETRFRALVENSSDAISVSDARGNLFYASASNARVLGYEPEDLVGRNWLELVHEDDAPGMQRIFHDVILRPRSPLGIEARIRHRNGRWCWVESTASNLLDEPGVGGIVLNYRDVSERRKAEEKKQRDAEILLRSNEELQSFARAAAHDLKEPLRTICSYTQLMTQEEQSEENRRVFAGIVTDGVSRMSSLLDDLLAFTSMDFSGKPSRVELNEIVVQATKNLGEAIGENGATLTVDPLPAVMGHETHLLQLFQNVIGNATKYRGTEPLKIHITARRLGQEWLLKVEDNGIGIPPEHHDRVFGLFTRLHGPEIPGTGIGLALCRKIVEGAGGRIWVESAPRRGSRFCFTVLAGENAGENRDNGPSVSEEGANTESGSVAKVLLIEDSPSDAYLVRLALEQTALKPELMHYTDPDKALEMLANLDSESAPDLLILDLNIPRKDGFEVIAALRDMPRLSEMPVLILTSSISPDDRRRAALAGVRRYVSKPMMLEDFLRTVGTAVQETIGETRGHRQSN